MRQETIVRVDHIFIFTDPDGEIADDLVKFGLTEGSSRVHAGQGTTNRKFYFENFFLEILWVHNPKEINSEPALSSGLGVRAKNSDHGFSPFGLCLVNTKESDALFTDAFPYQPNYFPQGMAVDVLKNEEQSELPWTFRLPFKGPKKYENEPKSHRNGISVLDKALFEYPESSSQQYTDFFKHSEQVFFKPSNRVWLTLYFDQGRQEKIKSFEPLKLTIAY
ncbi:hypothetical protein SAMN04490243_2542 [Robiginitalea myxolifaciens]|uniref:Glyoxalase-like domain-containing protein n=1 Tax=Robiginitalea myxolifaciens TaxID=400055 RepID=A0A1I6HC42_9FLAO|nr:hypothetical protein [Robiginitalea myxolifaciens]SFR52013.1 hypothetical protein SAMN04490243_2542 [Robiginitalea myxolifaciens]